MDNPFKSRLKEISYRNRQKKHIPGTPWSDEKKLEVVQEYLIMGNMRMVATATGVPYEVIRKWKSNPWWAEMVAQIRSTQSLEMDSKMSEIVAKSLDAVLDRVENGDFIYDQKTGEVRRKPAALRDLHRVAVDVLGKREILRDKSEENKQVASVTVAEHLKMLANEMSKWNKPKQHAIILEDVQDAIPNERKTGLQEGTGLGTQEEAGTGEGTSGAEFSSEDDGRSREGS